MVEYKAHMVVEYKTHILEAQVQGMSPVSREIILACEQVLAAIVELFEWRVLHLDLEIKKRNFGEK